eukprot:6353475-Amphidinium_carterae.1
MLDCGFLWFLVVLVDFLALALSADPKVELPIANAPVLHARFQPLDVVSFGLNVPFDLAVC